MSIPFLKMHGLGNDFVVIDGRETGFLPDGKFCLAVADRHRGVGYDQLIVLGKPQDPTADFFMHMFNADGSKAGACGNATRCVARLLFEETGQSQGAVQTVAGVLKVWKEDNGLIAVDFGPPRLDWREIPLAQACDTNDVALVGLSVPPASCASMGNPHAVFFVKDAESIKLEEIGPLLERHNMFPDRANIEFAHIIDKTNIRMRVWERGAGITQACGSGSCAALVAAVRRGLSARRATIHLDGGELTVTWREEDEHVILSGPTALSFKGELAPIEA
jgi:diaminopimelate epimerase